MADYSVTAASVQIKPTSPQPINIVLGEPASQGELLYRGDDRLYYKSDSNATGKSRVDVLLLTPGETGDPAQAALPGSLVKLGSGVFSAAGVVAYLSKTAGKLCPVADVTGSGTAVEPIGVSSSADAMFFRPMQSGQVLP